jgi:outer membrane murein-binding lipoprotein Lpp
LRTSTLCAAAVAALLAGGIAVGAHTPKAPVCDACESIKKKLGSAIDDLTAKIDDLKARIEKLEKTPAKALRCKQVSDRKTSFVKLGATDFSYVPNMEKDTQITGGGCEASSPSHAVIVSLASSGPISATDDPSRTIGWKCSANVTSAPARAPIGPVEVDLRASVIACE